MRTKELSYDVGTLNLLNYVDCGGGEYGGRNLEEVFVSGCEK